MHIDCHSKRSTIYCEVEKTQQVVKQYIWYDAILLRNYKFRYMKEDTCRIVNSDDFWMEGS